MTRFKPLNTVLDALRNERLRSVWDAYKRRYAGGLVKFRVAQVELAVMIDEMKITAIGAMGMVRQLR